MTDVVLISAKRNGAKRLLENVVSLAILQGARYVVPLITLPYLVRVLGTENFGLLAFAQAFVQYASVLTDYSFNLTATRHIAIHREDARKTSEIFSTVMAIRLGLLVLSFIVMALVVFLVPRFRVDWPLYGSAFLMVVGNVLFPIWLFQGLEEMKYITVLNVVAKTIGTIAVFVFVHRRNDYCLAALIQSLSSVFIGVVGLYTLKSVYRITLIMPTIKGIRDTLADGWHVFLAQVAATMFGPSNIFILGLFADHTAVGYYSIAEKIVRAVICLSVPISNAVYPRVSGLFVRSHASALVLLRRVLLSGGGLFLGLSLCLYMFPNVAVRVVAGQTIGDVSLLIRIMALLPFTIFVDNIYGTQIMLNLGMEKQFTSAVVISGLISLTLSFALVPRFTAIGSSVSFLVSEVMALILMFWPVHRAGINLLKVGQCA